VVSVATTNAPNPPGNGTTSSATVGVDSATDELATFAKVVAHDFSSPLQAIRGFGALLLETTGDRISEPEREYLHEIVGAANRMQALNDGLSTWIRARNAVFDVKEVALESIVNESLDAFRASIAERDVQVTVSALPLIWADAASIRVVLDHLLKNALRAMAAEHLPVILIQGSTSAREVTVAVEDNGLGLSESSRERAFGLFKRLDPKSEAGSIGMGLTLSRTIVERHGGRLWLEAAPRRGTRAMFTLPIDRSRIARPSEGTSPSAETARSRHLQHQAALAKIVEFSDEAIFSKDLDGHITTWNNASEVLYGYSSAEAIGKHVSMLITPERLPELPGLMDRVRRGEPTHRETVRIRKDRTLVDVALTISPLRDADGELVGASVIARDITERRQIEADLRAFLELAPDAIVVVDITGVIRTVNSQTVGMFGYPADELVGLPFERLLPHRFADVAQQIARVTERVPLSIETNLETFGLRRDGTEFPVDIQLSTLPSKDGSLPVAAIRDVTERQRRDQRRRDFVANAAHELRTPLTTLAGLGETLSRRYGSMEHADVEDAFAAMARQGERARVLLANLLDLSNIEDGSSKFAIVDVRLTSLLNQALDATPPPDGKIVTIAAASDVVVRADPDRLAQVVTNLLVNAYRYGGQEVRIHALADPTQVIIVVSDDGPGVEPDLLPALFEPFTRGRSAGISRGSGIGLALCRCILERMNGVITYQSVQPNGSRFSVILRRPA
jgi:PAS domain S-box-containing protein